MRPPLSVRPGLAIDAGAVRRDNGYMSTFVWPTDDGWPYPDTPDDAEELADIDFEADDDLLDLQRDPRHLLDGLDPLERRVVVSRFGLGGEQPRTMRELVADTGRPRQELREALGSGLAKLRTHFSA